MEIRNAVFIITGAASPRGLGGATAGMLVRAGAKVIIADLNHEVGEAHAAELGDAARFVRTDVTDEASAQAAIAAAQREFGDLCGLVNCAGIPLAEKMVGKQGPHRLESFARCIQVNLVGTFNMIRLAADAMSRRPAGAEGERGVIINTGSFAATEGQIGQTAYAASKGAIASMTLPIARELARFGIRVVTIAPGVFRTPMMDTLPQEVQDVLTAGVPFPYRLGNPDEYAHMARSVIENIMLNGEVIRLDGGMRMAAK